MARKTQTRIAREKFYARQRYADKIAKQAPTQFITKENYEYYERHCKGKLPWKTLGKAQNHAVSLSVSTHRNYTAYKCKFCKFFHAGHLKRDEYGLAV